MSHLHGNQVSSLSGQRWLRSNELKTDRRSKIASAIRSVFAFRVTIALWELFVLELEEWDGIHKIIVCNSQLVIHVMCSRIHIVRLFLSRKQQRSLRRAFREKKISELVI